MTAHHRTPEWRTVQRQQRPRVAAALPTQCVERCGRVVEPGTPFDLAHVTSVDEGRRLGWTTAQINDPSNIGPAHPSCNRQAGGRAGAKISHANARTKRRLPKW